jgi:hypothetical protein
MTSVPFVSSTSSHGVRGTESRLRQSAAFLSLLEQGHRIPRSNVRLPYASRLLPSGMGLLLLHTSLRPGPFASAGVRLVRSASRQELLWHRRDWLSLWTIMAPLREQRYRPSGTTT